MNLDNFEDKEAKNHYKNAVIKILKETFDSKISVDALERSIIKEFNENFSRLMEESTYSNYNIPSTVNISVFPVSLEALYKNTYMQLRNAIDMLEKDEFAKFYEELMYAKKEFEKEKLRSWIDRHPHLSKLLRISV
ncbi:MAG: hypothetical protein ACP5TL_00780 [Candidatus Micrarchaeia archaeon]